MDTNSYNSHHFVSIKSLFSRNMNKKASEILALKSFTVLLQRIHEKDLFFSTEFVEDPLNIPHLGPNSS